MTTQAASTRVPPTCPACGSKGTKVGYLTLDSLLRAQAKQNLSADQQYYFCQQQDCDLVYFDSSAVAPFSTGDLSVEVFQKSDNPQRLACHCFDHSVASLEEEVRRTGVSSVPDEIGKKCKAGLDRCEETNPQGRCCLGNVRRVVKLAMATGEPVNKDSAVAAMTQDLRSQEEVEDCCGSKVAEGAATTDGCCVPPPTATEVGPRENLGLWSAGGAAVAAVLSSACCWLPLLLIGFGASAAGVAGFFEAYRVYLLGATTLLLGTGFYYVYFREPKCAPGEACAVPNPKLQRLNKIMLWTATAFVVAFATFPNYVGLVLAAGEDSTPTATSQAGKVESDAPIQVAQLTTRAYQITGMTCEGCSANVTTALEKLPGVRSASVDYPQKLARVQFEASGVADDAAVLAAVESAGYEATVVAKDQAAGQ